MNRSGFGTAGALVVALLAGPVVRAQSDTSVSGRQTPAVMPGGPPAPAAKDALGRDTPRGTLFGFMRAARDGNDELAAAYLNTGLRGQAAVNLTRQLYVVLDKRLPARLAEVSERAEGALANPLKPDLDLVGTIDTAGGPLEIFVERVNRGEPGRVWLFSRRTLEAIPDVYGEINLVRPDRYLPRPLTKFRIAGVRLFDWIVLVIIGPLCYRLLGLLGALAQSILVRVGRRYGRGGAATQHPLPGFIRLLLLAALMRWLVGGVELPLVERQFWSTIVAMLSIAAVMWLLLLANAAGERYCQRRFAVAGHGEIAALLRLTRRLVDVLVIAAGAIVTLHFYGIDPTAALAGLGIGGIAVALAAQKTLENVVGGLSIIFDKAVRVGDFLKLGETFGTVDYIGLRSTRIRTLDRTILSVPNGQIANTGIETLSSRDKFWFHHVIGVRYETTSRQLRAVVDGMRRRLAGHSSIDVESVRVRLIRFGPSSLDIELFAYLFAGDWVRFLEIQEDLLLDLMEIVEAAGATIALPSQTLYLADPRAPAPPAGGAVAAGASRFGAGAS
jgi:MscS family membrane protein